MDAVPRNELLQNRNREVKRVSYEAAMKVPTTAEMEFILPYVKDLKLAIDMEAIRSAGLKLG